MYHITAVTSAIAEPNHSTVGLGNPYSIRHLVGRSIWGRVWRVRGKTIRSVLCNIVCNNCAQCDAHTYEQTNSSLDWVLSHWAHFTVLRLDSFLHVLCVLCIMCACVGL